MSRNVENVIKCMLTMQRHPWEHGVCAQALYEAGREDLWIPMAYDAVKRQGRDGRLAMIGGGSAVCDPAANGEVCLRAYEKTGNPFYLEGAQRMLRYLKNGAPRTVDGVICHVNASFEEGFSPYQVWIDGLYMAPPFLAVMGDIYEAVEQVRGYIRYLFDTNTGLFYHNMDAAQGRFIRKLHWATGNGWALMGLGRIIEAAMEQGYDDTAGELTAFQNCLLDAMLLWQLPDGRFRDILDDPESFPDGTSAMMTATAIYRGVVHGYIPSSRLEAAETAYETVSGKIDEFGLIHEVCGCPDFSTEGTSAEAQASFVMADTWRAAMSSGPMRTKTDQPM